MYSTVSNINDRVLDLDGAARGDDWQVVLLVVRDQLLHVLKHSVLRPNLQYNNKPASLS